MSNIEAITIEAAENGYMVQCRHAMPAKADMPYTEPSRYVYTSPDEALMKVKTLMGKLKKMHGGGKTGMGMR